nr:ribonuclease H-like domain-containing protein [Tanacetum cinerariifolium]
MTDTQPSNYDFLLTNLFPVPTGVTTSIPDPPSTRPSPTGPIPSVAHIPSTTNPPAFHDHIHVLSTPQPQIQSAFATTQTQSPLPRPTSSPIVPDIPQTATAQPATNLSNTHPIVTRAKDGISKPVDRLTLHTTTTSHLPRSHIHALRDPNWTPLDTKSKLRVGGDPVSDPMLYRSLAGALQYLIFTRPDISYAVQQVCLYMHDLREPYYTALKRILRDIRGTIDHGWTLVAYNLLFWSAKRHATLSSSSTEAEYRRVANVVAETTWLRNFLRELHAPLFTATLVYCGNVSAVYLSTNPVQHQRTKHIEFDIHFVRDFVAPGQVYVLHVPSRFQYANIFTKGLPRALFLEFRDSLKVRRPSVSTTGEY